MFVNHVLAAFHTDLMPFHAVPAAFLIILHSTLKKLLTGVITFVLNHSLTMPQISTIAFQQPCASSVATFHSDVKKSINGLKNCLIGSMTESLNHCATPDHIDLMPSQVDENRSFINCSTLSTTLRNPSKLSYSSLNMPANGLTIINSIACQFCLIKSTTVKNADLIPSQRLIQNSRNASHLFQRTTKAATSPATAATTNPIGLAAITTFKAACAKLMPFKAPMTLCITPTTLNAPNAAPIPARPAITISLLSITHCTRSITFVSAPSANDARLSASFSICCCVFGFSSHSLNFAARSFNFGNIFSLIGIKMPVSKLR